MSFEIKLPDLGEGVREGEILRWLVAEGDAIAVDQPVVEVMTDKVTAELPSPRAGRVGRILAAEGAVVEVGASLLVIEDGAAPTETPPTVPVAREAPAASPPQRTNGGLRAAPAVRRLARELGVDLAAVPGSGPEGRVREADVRAAAADGPSVAGEAPTRRPLRGFRRAIAEHMLEATQQAAGYTLVEEVDFTELVALRERARAIAASSGVRLTYLPFVITALVAALREHPLLNATIDAETGDLLVYPGQHIGVAVHTDNGLIVPVIHNAGRMGILELGRAIERLSTAAREGRLTREETTAGTFTVTSVGPLGGVMGTPILNTPQVATLAVHRIEPRPAARDGAVVVRQVANLSLTMDHRWIDGQVGAEFMATLRAHLQDPAGLMFWHAEMREKR